jgi:hypothetical protein
MLIADLLSVWMGRGIPPTRAYSALASQLEIVPTDADEPYTIDGDLYRLQASLRIAIGPRLQFVDPRR